MISQLHKIVTYIPNKWITYVLRKGIWKKFSKERNKELKAEETDQGENNLEKRKFTRISTWVTSGTS